MMDFVSQLINMYNAMSRLSCASPYLPLAVVAEPLNHIALAPTDRRRPRPFTHSTLLERASLAPL